MQHFPVFLSVAGRRVVVAGAGECAMAKLRLLLKTEALIEVYAVAAEPEVEALAAASKLRLIRRELVAGDARGAVFLYAAHDDAPADARAAALARADGVFANIVDNLTDSDFLTPAIVDRDPVVVAIGTEGAAPVLARAIKADLEERLPVRLGLLARIGKAFRHAAEALPMGRARRDFWAEYYQTTGPATADRDLEPALDALLARHLSAEAKPGHVDLVGAGPGDPELLTLKARRALDRADVVVYDRLVAPAILELARREAVLIDAGKEGFGPSTAQSAIHDAMITHAAQGLHVVRLKSGDATVFGRLDEEIEALDAAGIGWTIVPGITAASAAAAQIGQSLTRRGRNSAVRFLTGHDVAGFAEQDWRSLARPGEVAAVYMAKKGARFLQGRLLMHGADPQTPMSVVENAGRPEARVIATVLCRLEPTLSQAGLTGPAIIFLGLAPREAAALTETLHQEIAL